jgi:hypothetical protein
VCKALSPIVNKDNSKTATWSQKVYDFDITKAGIIFYMLLKDKHITLSEDHKFLTPDQLKGQNYCKFHNKIGYTTNSCIHFRDLIQQSIKDGILKFEENKSATKVYSDPLP